MSQPGVQPLPRRKPPRESSTVIPEGLHKLKQVYSSSSYGLESIDGKSASSREKIAPEVARRRISQPGKTIDKTTSSGNFTGRKLWNNCAKAPEVSAIGKKVDEENELIAMLTKQLCLAETQLRRMQENLGKNEEKLRTKEREIGSLKRKVKDWETRNKNQEILRKKEQYQRRNQNYNAEYLYRRCLMLEQKIFEMEKFLADYGLVWVGDTNNKNQPETIANNYINNCYDQLSANIDQLNHAAGKDEVHVHRKENGGGAIFKTPSCMSLKFYKNGMTVENGALRAYTDPATGCFIRDILDGYFPSELQQTYPNGVPFKVEDRRGEIYGGTESGFPGQGYRLAKHLPTESTPLSAKPKKFNNSFQRTGRTGLTVKQNSKNEQVNSNFVPSSARSMRSKSSVESPSVDMLNLRTQILASHNNNCSDTHLQSHLNAELALSGRKEKRDLATRNTDCDLIVQQCLTKSKPTSRNSSGRRSHHSSSDRSSISSPRRRENSVEGGKIRARSADSSDGKNEWKISNRSNFGDGPRLTKSMTQARKGAPPILHQVNEPTGKAEELRLKVRSLNGGTVYMIHVSAEESVASLYQLLNKAMSRSSSRGYKIVVSGYSPRRLEELESSLRENGITRDCVLHLVND